MATLAATVKAHTTVYAVWVNEVDQGLGCGQLASGKQTGESIYIRCPPNNNPVKVKIFPKQIYYQGLGSNEVLSHVGS